MKVSPVIKSWITFILWFLVIALNLIEFYYPKVRSQGKEVFTNWWMNLQLFKQKYPNVPHHVTDVLSRLDTRMFGTELLSYRAIVVSCLISILPVGLIILIPTQTTVLLEGKQINFPERDWVAYTIFFLFLFVPNTLLDITSMTISRALLRWLHRSFGFLKLLFSIVIDLFCAYLLIVILIVVFALFVPFWILPYAPHEPPIWAESAKYLDTPFGSFCIYVGFIYYIFSAAIPTIFILLVHIIIFLIKCLERPIFYFLVYTIEAMQRTDKWLLALLVNIFTVIWTLTVHYEKLFG